jgi:crotonobetainyl-CoA:carnitine CoA-transferase CaiB-like acyl-CoA transferase
VKKTDNRGLLTGALVLDFTQFLSGASRTQMPADTRADVIKVEALTGNLVQAVTPHFIEGDNGNYQAIDVNKSYIMFDLKTPDDVELAAKFYVVIENTRLGVMEHLGIGPQKLVAHGEQLVYCGSGGFEEKGPACSVLAAPVNKLDAGLTTTQVTYRGMVATLAGETDTAVQGPRDPLKLSVEQHPPAKHPSHLKQHNREILRELLSLDDDKPNLYLNQQIAQQDSPSRINPALARI